MKQRIWRDNITNEMISEKKIQDNPKVIFADPWLKKAEKTASLPEDARFACAYELNLVVDQFDEAAFLRRTETTDELWIGAGR